MTVTNVVVGAVGDSDALVIATVSGSSIRLAVSVDPAIDQPTFFGPVSPTAEGVASIQATGLTADTQYYYAIEEDDVQDTTFTGAFRTHPEIGAQASFSFAAAGDAGGNPDHPGVGDVLAADRLSNAPVYDTIRTHASDPLFFVHLGDMHYYDLGSGNHGITGGGSLDNYRRALDDVLLQPRQHNLFRKIPLVYAWDDHDYGPNNSDGTLPDKDNAATVYREKVPSYDLPDSGAIYHSFQVGRVLVVVWDTRFYRSPSSDPDDATKTMLGGGQKQWFRNLLNSTTAEALVVVSSVHWIITTSDDESWGSYATERQEIADFLIDSGWADRMIMLCADRHAIMMDSGGSNDWGGFPTYGFASLDAGPHSSDWPHDIGISSNRNQYGIVTVTDDGDAITLTSRGWRGNSAILTHERTIQLTTEDPPDTTPNVPFTPGEARQSVTWLACNLISGDIIAELPELRGKVKRVIGELTSSSMTLPIPFAGPGALPTHVWQQATALARVMFVPIVNDVPAAAFIPMEPEGGTEAELQLGCVSLEGYLEHRFVRDHKWVQEDEASVIAAGLLADAQIEGIDLVVDAPPTGVPRDREYFDSDDGTVYERLTELAGIDDGIEWTIDVDWADSTRRSVAKIARIRKRIGIASTKPNAVYATESAADVTYTYKESYADGRGANHVIATSSGQGEDRPQSAAMSDVMPGWPRYERRFSPGSNIKSTDVLNDHALAELARLRDGTRTFKVSARWDARPRLGVDWRMGDDIGLELTGHRHPFGITVVRRCIGWELDMQSGIVTPILLGGDA